MYPPVALGQLRISSSDFALGAKLVIPAGAIMWIPHHSVQNVSFNWDQPEEFLPGEMQKGSETYKLSLDHVIGGVVASITSALHLYYTYGMNILGVLKRKLRPAVQQFEH